MSKLHVSSQKISVNGLTFHVVEQGKGPAVLLLHGNPDSWYLWRHQIPVLADAGFRVIAPDLRGYGESDKPSEVAAYEMPHLVQDVKGILDALGVERTHIISHDWGANVGWAFVSQYQNRVERFVAMASGHPKFARSIEAYEKSWYIYFFQFQGIAEEFFMRDNWALFREWARNHSEVDHWIKELSRPGALIAAMNWYRANYNPYNNFTVPMAYSSIEVPTLGIFGVHDPYLLEQRMVNSAQHVTGPWRYEKVDDAGHWLQLDQPDYINKLLLEFLGQ